jgi:hydrogenase/urease accessory protein HupE
VRSTRPTRASRPGLPAIVLLVTCCVSARVRAHDPGLSALDVVIGDSHVGVALAFAVGDADAVPMPSDPVHVWSDGVPLRPTMRRGTTDPREGVRVEWQFRGRPARTLTIASSVAAHAPRGHRQLVSVRTSAGVVLAEQLLDSASNSVTVTLTDSPARGAALRFFTLGIHHLVTGYDHVLFLAAMLLVVARFAEAAAIVTAFSAAHAVALALASFGLVTVPAEVVEPLIAASVIWVGVDNVRKRDAGRRWQPAFAFGLVHGLGFASALSELNRADGGPSLVLQLACFNAGIEAGQLAIAAVVLPLLWRARAWPLAAARLRTIGSMCIVVAGGYWLVERLVPAFV